MPITAQIDLPDLATRFIGQLAHCQRLGLTVHHIETNKVELKLPYSTDLVGYPDTGVVHGGVITTLIDTACGCAVVCAIFEQFQSLEISPTLDLRVDYMRPAEPHKPIYGLAECYKLTSNIAFVRALAYQDDVEQPIAHAVATFMRISAEMVGDEFRQALLGQVDTQASAKDGQQS
ncbi:PaaI family thioesterase [Shewanella marina]|uniref:PaaI family thioesterase n=1 Tax=Shewanella marina TaxID=487319 RepID=UPI00046F4239|nr:PaaI family thioesterase [Shewanella marina]